MKQCPFSLISLKNILHETLLRGYHSAWCGRQLKISRSVCVLVCPGWFCFWGVLTGHSSSLTPASHRWMGPSLDTLTSAPGSHFVSLPFTKPLNSPSSLFRYTEYEASLVECAFSSRNILTFHILKTIKNPLKSPLLQAELAARTSSSAYLSITCIIAVHFLQWLYCFCNHIFRRRSTMEVRSSGHEQVETSSSCTLATTRKLLLCARLGRCSLGQRGTWRPWQAQSSMGLLNPVWAGQQLVSKETHGHCSQGHLAPADYDACLFSLYWYHQPSPGTGTALPLQVFHPHYLRSPAVYQLCGKLVHLCLSFFICEMGLIFIKIKWVILVKWLEWCLTQRVLAIITIIILVTMSMDSALDEDIIWAGVGGCPRENLVVICLCYHSQHRHQMGFMLNAYLTETLERRNSPAEKPHMSITFPEAQFEFVFVCGAR